MRLASRGDRASVIHALGNALAATDEVVPKLRDGELVVPVLVGRGQRLRARAEQVDDDEEAVPRDSIRKKVGCGALDAIVAGSPRTICARARTAVG